ncbi:Glutathione S-transferase N-terminal domain family protein [Acanthocheilonema viteae]
MFHSLLIWILCLSSISITIANKPAKIVRKFLRKGDPEPSKDGIIRIYAKRFCPYCDRVIIAAYKKGIQFEVFHIDFQNKPEWFILKNPEESVPLLDHNGKLVIDSRVIIEYLDETFPETSILSKDSYLRAKQRYYALKLEPICETIKQMTYSTKLTGNITVLALELATAEQLLQSPFYSGEVPSLPDIILFPFIHRLHIIRQFIRDNFLDHYFPNNYPKLVKWFIAMRNMPEIRAVQEPEHHLRAYLISKTTDFNTKVGSNLNSPTPVSWKLLNDSVVQYRLNNAQN